jgi:hypothetical protein
VSPDPATRALAKAMATMDGVLDAFLSEASGAVDPNHPAYTGHFDGYMAEAAAILEALEADGFWLLKVDTTQGNAPS